MGRDNSVGIVADEHPLCGAGLAHMMESCLNFSKVLTCRNFAELGGVLGQYQSHVILAVIHYDLPGMKRTTGLRRLCAEWPSVRFLITADTCERETILAVLAAGSHGFIPKNSPTPELEHALMATAGGHFFVPPVAVEHADPDPWHSRAAIDETKLTGRQKEVLSLVAAGKSNKQIAWELGISEGTVKVHVNAAFRVLGVHNRVNAATALMALA